MKNLSQHNSENNKGKSKLTEDTPKKNGISCDYCGHELEDLNNTMLASDPPQVEVHCAHCGFQGKRFT